MSPYEQALQTFRTASAAYRHAREEYRARHMSDEQFDEARLAFQWAQVRMDAAEKVAKAEGRET